MNKTSARNIIIFRPDRVVLKRNRGKPCRFPIKNALATLAIIIHGHNNTFSFTETPPYMCIASPKKSTSTSPPHARSTPMQAAEEAEQVSLLSVQLQDHFCHHR